MSQTLPPLGPRRLGLWQRRADCSNDSVAVRRLGGAAASRGHAGRRLELPRRPLCSRDFGKTLWSPGRVSARLDLTSVTLWSADALRLGLLQKHHAASPAWDKDVVMGDSRTGGGRTATSSSQLAAPALGWLRLEHERLGALSPCRQPALGEGSASGRGLRAARLGSAAGMAMEAPAPRLPSHSLPREQGRWAALFPTTISDFVDGKERSGPQKFHFLHTPPHSSAS